MCVCGEGVVTVVSFPANDVRKSARRPADKIKEEVRNETYVLSCREGTKRIRSTTKKRWKKQ